MFQVKPRELNVILYFLTSSVQIRCTEVFIPSIETFGVFLQMEITEWNCYEISYCHYNFIVR